MTVKTGQAWAGAFVTLDATGALATPSTGPAGVLYIDGTANGATVTISGSNPYKWAVTLPSLTAGQRVDMYVTATISSIATAGFVASDQADTALLSDGVAVASIATDAITAASVKEDAVTKLQANLALEDTLTAIKGAGWTTETLKAIWTEATHANNNAENTYLEVADGGRLDLLIDSIIAHLVAIKGAGWTNETLAAIDVLIDAIKAKSDLIPASPAEAGEYTEAIGAIKTKTDQLVFTTPNKVDATATIDTTGIATSAALAVVDANVEAIKAKTDNLPTDPADDSEVKAEIAAVKSVVDAIKTETDSHPTAAEVWSYGTRTLTTAVAGAVTPAEGDTLEIIKDATVIINFTGLGDITDYDDNTPGQEDKVWFTAKKNLDDPDTSAVIQIYTLYPAGVNPPDTLTYINGAAATATEGTFQFTNTTTGDATLTLAAAAAADLPIYAVSPLYWDIKILKYSTGIVSILASGEMYIYGTPTISIS